VRVLKQDAWSAVARVFDSSWKRQYAKMLGMNLKRLAGRRLWLKQSLQIEVIDLREKWGKLLVNHGVEAGRGHRYKYGWNDEDEIEGSYRIGHKNSGAIFAHWDRVGGTEPAIRIKFQSMESFRWVSIRGYCDVPSVLGNLR